MEQYTVRKNSTGLTIVKYLGNETDVKIPKKIKETLVTSIGNYAFASNKLISVVIPDGVTSIGYNAFSDNSLTSVKIPNGATSIGYSAFASNNLTSVVIPPGVTSIEDYAFFKNNLTSVVIPNSITSIGYNAFIFNKNISSITYLGKKLKVKCIDGDIMIIDSKKKKEDYKIYKCRYFGGDFEECFVAEKGKFFAHGNSIKQAIEDVGFKFLQENFDVETLVSEIKEKGTVSVNEYRLLTGACSLGCENFRKENNIKETEISLERVLEITKGNYGNEKMLELFN